MSNLFIRILRKRISYQYKRFPDKPDAWDNNDFNNMLDDYILFSDEAEIFRAKVQTVANIPGGRFADTISSGANGHFKLKAFVGEGPNADPRNFYGRIHALCDCYDLEGQYIDYNSVEAIVGKNGEPVSFTRWLNHDTQSLKPKPPMTITRVAWSAGCFVMSPSNLDGLGKIFDTCGVKSGDLIDGEILEV